MEPDLEVVQIRRGESFTAWSHGYPFHTVRWHFHPEYELHLVVSTTGRYFVGDFIGEFEPGNLVLTGPNLPHNWVSDLPEGASIPLRGRVIQFSEMLHRRRHEGAAGTRCLGATAGVIAPWRALPAEIGQSGFAADRRTHGGAGRSPHRTVHDAGRRTEPRQSHQDACQRRAICPDPSGYMSAGINKALAYIRENLTQPFDEVDLAAIAGQSTGAFSRAFRKHTGMSLVQYVKRLRINLACQILMSEEQASITDICFEVGFNNLSNFNRQFLAEKGMPPSRFRRLLADNIDAMRAA